MKETLAIALSGGVDSLVCAHLLKQQGHPLIGIHFITGFETPPTSSGEPTGPLPLSSNRAAAFAKQKMAAISDRLGIPIEVTDIGKVFKERVIGYFIREYRSGKTPNPCMICNTSIKFGILLKEAEKLGAKRLATGHYARAIKGEDGRFHLFRGKDPVKDQSYFLALLNQHQLASACFPLGHMKKAEVQALAEKENLRSFAEFESQDVCFIKNQSYGDFLSLQDGIQAKPGPIVDVHGNNLGVHAGLHLFTVGQRRGINCPAKAPYYVIRLDLEENRLVVGFEHDLLARECIVTGINWLGNPPPSPLVVDTQVRYRHRAAGSCLTLTDDHTAVVCFEEPQPAVTPGQGAVFYQQDEVLGGGWIESGH